jgi:hypothetical protein
MARVIKQFDGVEDGKVIPRTFMPGDEVTGDLAVVALNEGWAEMPKPEADVEPGKPAKKSLKAAPENK